MCGHIMVSQQEHTMDLALAEPMKEVSSMDAKTTMNPTTMRRSNSKDSTRSKGKKIYVKHDYRDHYLDPYYDPIQAEQEREEGTRCGPRGGVVEPFPSRLYQMLKQAESEGFDKVVSWQPHGRCFLVHEPQEFVDQVMPRHFKQSKLTSFKRQVNLYGFQRLTRGPDRGAYYHALFLRGRPDLHKKIQRMRVKGTGCKPTSSPDTEPNLYALPFCYEKPEEEIGHTQGNECSTEGAGLGTQKTGALLQPTVATSLAPSRTPSKGFGMNGGSAVSAAGLVSASLSLQCHDHREHDPKARTASVDYRASLQDKIHEVLTDPFHDLLSPATNGKEQHAVSEASSDASSVTSSDASHTTSSSLASGTSSSLASGAVLRPLPAPRGFQRFNNFQPISESPEIEGSMHHNRMDVGRGSPDHSTRQRYSPGLALPIHKLPSLADCPTLTAKQPFCDPLPLPSPSPAQVLPSQMVPLRKQDSLEYNHTTKEPVKDLEYHHDPFQDQIKDLIQCPMPPMGKSDAFSLDSNDIELVMDWFRGQPLQRAFC